MLIWEDHWQVQWFLGNHCEFGFEVTIANFQWFLRRPSPLNIFRQSDHCYQWFFNGFWFCYHRFQWFSMVQYHWSNDAMVSMDRCGLIWWFIWKVENCRFERHFQANRLSQTLSVQEIHFCGRAGADDAQIGEQCCLLSLGSLQEHSSLQRTVDLPNIKAHCRIWRCWILFLFIK